MALEPRGVSLDETMRQHGIAPVYFEPAAFIVSLVLLGQVLELRARARTRGALKALLGLAPKIARRIEKDGAERDVPLAEVQPGDVLRVRPGEKVPVDGVVTEGRSSTAEALRLLRDEGIRVVMLTGDSRTNGADGGAQAGHRGLPGRGPTAMSFSSVLLIANALRLRRPGSDDLFSQASIGDNRLPAAAPSIRTGESDCFGLSD